MEGKIKAYFLGLIHKFVDSCGRCKKNTSAIIDLKEKFVIVSEQVMRQEHSPTYEDLLARIKTLEEEREL